MASSSKFIFLGILLAVILLVSSQVAANADDASAVNDAKYQGGGNGGYGGGNGGYGGGGNGGYGGGGNGGHGGGGNGGYGGGGNGGYGGGGRHGGGGGGYCRYGCCGKNYRRGGCRCCSFAGEKPVFETQN